MDATLHNARTADSDGIVLVIRVNSFTNKIDDGYVFGQAAKRIGEVKTAKEVGEYIARFPHTKIEVLKV